MKNSANRRAHRRVPSSELPEQALIRIPNRPAISLVDLSPGGALLELPFPLQPEARITLELSTSTERLAVPFQLLRCYVAELKEGVRYHAAGAFPQELKLRSRLAGLGAPTTTSDRLIESLEAFLSNCHMADVGSRGARFNELLAWVVAVLRRGEPPHVISAHIKTRLSGLFPTLAIGPASSSLFRDASTSARFFDLDFRSDRVLSSADRRFLRASAQLITLIRNAERESTPSVDDPTSPIEKLPSSLIVHSVADWQTLCRTAAAL